MSHILSRPYCVEAWTNAWLQADCLFNNTFTDQKPCSANIIGMPHEHHGISNHQCSNCLFNSFFRITLKKTSKLSIPGSFCRESTDDWWTPLTKHQWCGKCFHVTISSWLKLILGISRISDWITPLEWSQAGIQWCDLKFWLADYLWNWAKGTELTQCCLVKPAWHQRFRSTLDHVMAWCNNNVRYR